MLRSFPAFDLLKWKSVAGLRYCQLNLNRRLVNQSKTLISTDVNNTDTLYSKWKDKLLYSSFIEKHQLKLGYKQNKILESKLKKYEQNEFKKTSAVKPFALVLKQLQTPPRDERSDCYESCVEIADRPSTHQLPYQHLTLQVKTHQNSIQEPNGKLSTGEWMSDFEYYDETEENVTSFYGTPDPNEPASTIPCGGCGALLHCIESSIPGYLPGQLFKGKSKEQLLTTNCQRCHFLKHYNVAVNVTVSANDYIGILSSIKTKKALAVLLVDVLDFPCSIWPGLSEILGVQRPIIVVGNKVDLLPQDSAGYLENVRQCLTRSVIESGFSRNNIKHVSLISASTGYGVEELITKIHNVWGTRGDVYLVGCTNVGKSTLFNALLRSDLCKVQATDLIQKATASPWPGTTIRMLKFPILRPSDHRLFLRMKRLQQERYIKQANEKLRREQKNATKDSKQPTLLGHIGLTFEKEKGELFDHFSVTQRSDAPLPIFTLNEKNEKYINSKWCYDTPGVVQPDQILDLLTTEEIVLTVPKQIIRPRIYLLKRGMTLLLGGLGRLDFVEGPDSIRVILYASNMLPTIICQTLDAPALYEALLGTEFLGVPFGSQERLEKFPLLECVPNILVHGILEKHLTVCDILLSSAGWIGVNLPKNSEAIFHAWTPKKRGVYIRQPAILPNGLALRGKRIRRSLTYRTGTIFKPR
ncbi:nitric oxide-associated protein 1-like isoform X1 [Anopheles merus]|uniref:nitric oxide-associated protein 1-like isoform X1 n=1 Tax=Anopheles merus TaxID=30066 RepID=UPI001BE44C47|nr:nitric oxide-associated protein 1-like isoform X1 [Anopheles merus]